MELAVSESSGLEGEVSAPPSKSYTHRAIMLAGLGRGKCEVKEPLLSADPLSTIEAVRAAGAGISVKKRAITVKGTSGRVEAPSLVDVGNSGTTIRMMASVFSLCGGSVKLTGDRSVRKRPMGPLLEALRGLGVTVSSNGGKPPVTVKGPMRGGSVAIRGDVSSQYISGLLLACPLRGKSTRIDVTTPLKSRPYLDMTLDIIDDFGGRINNRGYESFEIPGGQFYSKGEYSVEGDYSGAAFILGASALTDSGVTVRNLPEDSKQGDRYFLDVLKMMGAKVETRGDSVTVIGGKSLRGADVDLSQTPDLLPITAVVCALAKGRSTICNVQHARLKESDRISAMAQGLNKMGAKVEERQDGLVIEGSSKLKGARVDGFDDHRIVMALAVAGLRAKGETRIKGAESVEISYPGFVKDLKSLGAGISRKPRK